MRPRTGRRCLTAVAVLALVASVAGCGRNQPVVDGSGVAYPRPVSSGNPQNALAVWQDFPVGRHPRPIVLMGPTVQFAGWTAGEAKEAAVSGSYVLRVPLPADPPATPVTLPDGPATLPVIGAAAAIDRMKTAGDPGASGSTVAPLPIVGIELATAAVATDRGTLTLPVWRVHTGDELGPTEVLAVADAALARPAGAPDPTGATNPGAATATVSADGRRLTLTMKETVPHCPGEAIYTNTSGVLESGSAVVVTFTPRKTGTVPGPSGQPCPLFLKLQPVTYRIELAAPLGARVLVDADARPVPVTS